MRNVLHDLYKAKLTLLATIFTFVGIGLMTLAAQASGDSQLAWLKRLPVSDLGSTLFVTGLVVILFDYLDERDSEERATARLRRILDEQAPAMRDAVIQGFAFKSEDLARVSSPEVLDQLTRNALAIQLGDKDFAAEVFEDIRDQVIRAGERQHDLQIDVDLSPWTGATGKAVTPLFVVSIRWEYSVVPKTTLRRFACVSDNQEYRELMSESASNHVWHFTPVNSLDGASKEAFELVQFSVDNTERPIRRSSKQGSQTYTVDVGKRYVDEGNPIRVAYTYRTLIRQQGHLLHLQLRRPTHGVSARVRYGDCGIDKLTVLDFFSSFRQTSVSRGPAALPEPTVSLDFDGWAFPRSGFALVWVLTAET